MRARIITSSAILLLIVSAVVAITPGAADDAADQRLSELETRVSALETQVAEPTPETSSNQQSSSSSSSSTSSGNSYTASFSGNGDREIEFEIDDAGTYQVTATTTSAFSAVIENERGDVVPDFSIDTDGPETVTRSGRLEPGNYVLRVTAPESWNVTVVLLAG
ncbi:MAG: hypothetical protein M3457_14225 [Chloroflexota bacterium]|nr:hypothetical protein [Chloroflexota bacterium]